MSSQISESLLAKAEALLSAKSEPGADRPRVLSMRRVVRKKAPKPSILCAYDYETTRIERGTPRPLYITAFGRQINMRYESSIDSMMHLQNILVNNFLTEENHGTKFIAWNGNNFDAYFTAAALVTHPDFVLRPYLTRSHSLRGIRVVRLEDCNRKNAPCWEFLDGIAVLGLVGVKLGKFLSTFAPDLPKLEGTIDFEVEEFDSGNAAHRAYAMRDSEGLDFAMHKAQDILMENFDQPLAVTMGGACIKILKANLPEDVVVRPNSEKLNGIIRHYAMRGGYCYCVRRYEGPVWKYDLNQAYAAAMRESLLPSGGAVHTSNAIRKVPSDGSEFQTAKTVMVEAAVYIVRIEAWNEANKIPFYCRSSVGGRMRSMFAIGHIPDTWVTSNEHKQLMSEGWRITIKESYAWSGAFNLKDYVDKLERKRMACEGGPSGSEGTIYKCVGNHSYGKLLEENENVSYILAADCPPGFVPHYPDGEENPIKHIYEQRDDDVHPKDYHQPHVGAFITAHVRMVVRRAALMDSDSWLYADTDCVVFSRDVTSRLDIDPKRYGAWKVEESGTDYQLIAKKVYVKKVDAQTALDWDHPDKATREAARAKVKGSAKGLHVKKVSPDMFTNWLNGTPPIQQQVQRNNFMKVIQGAEMYRLQTRQGTAVEGSA